MKSNLADKSLPFGVDLALPPIGGTARKTNYDYTKGKLDELINIIIESGAKLFISALGLPPSQTLKQLHDNGILVMSLAGAPRHAERALQAGVDLVCAQGGEGGGHTGDIASSILVPAVCDIAKGYKSPLTGQPVLVVAAGGQFDGRSLASSLMQGAVGVWVGTRFLASTESAASQQHKEAVLSADFKEIQRSLVLSGRPLRIRMNDYTRKWERERERMQKLLDKGIIPFDHDLENGEEVEFPYMMGQVAGVIREIKPARQIVNDMIQQAIQQLNMGQGYITTTPPSKL